MKRYIKILMITLGIQLGSLIIAMLLANMFRMQGNLALLGTVLLLISFPISIVVDIVLSIKWGASLAEKLIYIFFMSNKLYIVYIYSFCISGYKTVDGNTIQFIAEFWLKMNY